MLLTLAVETSWPCYMGCLCLQGLAGLKLGSSPSFQALRSSARLHAGYMLLTLAVETGWSGYLGRLCLRGLAGLGHRVSVLRGDDSMAGVSDPLLPWGEEDEDVRQERQHLLEHGARCACHWSGLCRLLAVKLCGYNGYV